MEIDLWQSRGLPFSEDAPPSGPSPMNRRSLKTKTQKTKTLENQTDFTKILGLPGPRPELSETVENTLSD